MAKPKFENEHIFLVEGNAEEVLLKAVDGIKAKVYMDSRVKAFEDCSQYWREVVEEILNDDIPPYEKVDRIRHKFSL